MSSGHGCTTHVSVLNITEVQTSKQDDKFGAIFILPQF
jgi:hypothetical protein